MADHHRHAIFICSIVDGCYIGGYVVVRKFLHIHAQHDSATRRWLVRIDVIAGITYAIIFLLHVSVLFIRIHALLSLQIRSLIWYGIDYRCRVSIARESFDD